MTGSGPPAAGTSCLITGGSGFIGSHLADALLARGCQVAVLDNLATGSRANLTGAMRHPALRFVHGSVLDAPQVDELASQCDIVVHLAAAVGVKLILEQPLRSLKTNLRGSEIVIEAAHRYGCKIMLASTSEIYGKNSSGALPEDSDRILGSPAIARWAYSAAKGIDEILANAYHQERGLRSIIVRLFNTVGPRQTGTYGMVIPRLVGQALRGETVTVFGDGRQTRCFTHVADVVEAMIALLGQDRAIGHTFNIGSSNEISITELARLIIGRCGSQSSLTFVPYEQAYPAGFEDMERRIPDTAKIRCLTGWSPRHSLQDILTDVIAEVSHAVSTAESLVAAP